MPITIPEQQEFHELTIEWPSSKPQSVILTGEFDHWSRSLHLKRTPVGTFAGTIRVPYGQPTRYKFIVDGKWMVREGAPTDVSPEGFVNNIYWAPAEGVLAGTDRTKGQQRGEEKGKGEEKEKSKVMVDKAVNGEVEGGDAKQEPPSIQAAIATSATALTPADSLALAPDVPLPILPVVDKDEATGKSSSVPQVSSNDAPGSQGEASESDKHTHIVPAAAIGPPSAPIVGKEVTADHTKEAKANDKNGSSDSAAASTAVADKSEGSKHHSTSADPEPEDRARTPTGTKAPPATESPKAATHNKSASTASTPSSSPLSSPSKSHRSHSKSSSFLGTWRMGRRVSSPLHENGSLERRGSKASSSGSSGSNLAGNGKRRKRRSSILERLKHGMSELFHHHAKEKSESSV